MISELLLILSSRTKKQMFTERQQFVFLLYFFVLLAVSVFDIQLYACFAVLLLQKLDALDTQKLLHNSQLLKNFDRKFLCNIFFYKIGSNLYFREFQIPSKLIVENQLQVSTSNTERSEQIVKEMGGEAQRRGDGGEGESLYEEVDVDSYVIKDEAVAERDQNETFEI